MLGIRPIVCDQVVKKLWAFSLDQWVVVERALGYVQRGGPVGDTYALELICADFLAGVRDEASEAIDMSCPSCGKDGTIMALKGGGLGCYNCQASITEGRSNA